MALILLYNFLWLLIYVVSLPYTLYKYLKLPEEWHERMGRYHFDFSRSSRGIWVHGASLGEIGAASQLVRRLRKRCPSQRIIVSAMTAAGKVRAGEIMAGADAFVIMPFDFIPLVWRAVRRINPATLILIETEIWPSLLFLARRRGVQVVLANARISDRTYRRYLKFGSVTRWLFNQINLYCPKNHDERKKFIHLGVNEDKIKLTGCLKSDNGIKHPVSRDELFIPENRLIVVAGSVRKGEESIVIKAFKELQTEQKNCYLIIAPRHMNRVSEMEGMLKREGLTYMKRTLKRSYQTEQVMILDTIGELGNIYSVADVAFVGGTLLPYGGHNLLEPASFGVPILFGPHVNNIRADVEEFLETGCAIMVKDGGELVSALSTLLRDPERRARMGKNALTLLEQKQGIVERYITVLVKNGVL